MLTNSGSNLQLAQMLFAGIYMINLLLVLRLYSKLSKVCYHSPTLTSLTSLFSIKGCPVSSNPSSFSLPHCLSRPLNIRVTNVQRLCCYGDIVFSHFVFNTGQLDTRMLYIQVMIQ